jgi:hypothetical protein
LDWFSCTAQLTGIAEATNFRPEKYDAKALVVTPADFMGYPAQLHILHHKAMENHHF